MRRDHEYFHHSSPHGGQHPRPLLQACDRVEERISPSLQYRADGHAEAVSADHRHWPGPGRPDDYGAGVLEQVFLSLGFTDCAADIRVESGFEKVALYDNGLFYTHAARQLSSGKWTSKLGKEDDIEHDTPDDVAAGL